MSLQLPATLDPLTGRAPSSRFKDADEVRQLCEDMRTADRARSNNRAKVQGLIDGNRPIPQGALISAGQGWRANVNFREAEGLVQAQRTPYYDLVTEVNPCIECQIDFGFGSKYKRYEWQQIIAEEFHRTLFGWNSWDWHIQLRQSEEMIHGWGVHLTMDAYDWRVSTKVMRDVLFPDGTTSDLEDLEFFCVRDTVKAHKLYEAIRNESAATLVGWDVKQVKDAILEAATTKAGHGNRQTNAEEVQQRLKNGDMGFGWNGATSITLNHFFVREYGTRKAPGGITHYIIVENSTKALGFLFERKNRFKHFGQILHFFPYDIGSDGTIHSIRGLGVRIFPFCELFNRLKNHMVDNVLVNSGILLTQTGNGVDLQRLQLTRIGALNILPAGVNPAQWRPMDLNQGPIPLARELQGTMQENTKTYRQQMVDAGHERTATEVAINNADTAKLAKSAHNMEYRALSKMYREQLRRLSDPNVTTAHRGGKEAVAFQERCFRRGVPKAAFSHIIDVTATRSLGAGSASHRLQVTTALMNTVYPIVGPQEQNNIIRDFVAAMAGQNAVNRYVPAMDAHSIPTDDDSVAVLENDALINGGEALVAPNQNHVRHASRHLQKAFSFVPALQAGQVDPQSVLAAWEAIGPHASLHTAYIAKDQTQKNEFLALKAKLTELSQLTDKLRQHLEQQAQAAETEAQLAQVAGQDGQQALGSGDPELDLAYEKLRGEMTLKFEDLKQKMQLRGDQARHAMRLKEDKQNTARNVQEKLADAKIDVMKQQASAGGNGKRPYTRPGSK